MSDSKKTKTSFSLGVFLNGASTIINVVLLFMEAGIASRFVTADNNGIFVVLIGFINLFMVFSDLGFKSGITQRIAAASEKVQEKLANSAVTFRLILTSVIALALWLLRHYIATFEGYESIDSQMVYIIPMFFATSFDELMIGTLRGFQIHKPLATLQIVKAVTRLSTTIVLVYFFDLQLIGLIISWTASHGLAAFFSYLSLPIRRRLTLDMPTLKDLLAFSRPLIVIRIVAFFRQHASTTLLIAGLLGPAGAAFYAFALKIPSGIQSLTEAYNNVFYPRMTELRANGDIEGANRLLNHSLRMLSFFLSGIALGGFLFGNEIMGLLFGETYAAVGTLFGLILVGLQMQVVITFMGYALMGAGHPKENSVLIAVSTPIVLGLNYILILFLGAGVLGPAIGTIIEGNVLAPIFIRIGKLHEYAIKMWGYLKSTILMGMGICLSYFIEQAMGSSAYSLTSWGLNIAILLAFVGLNYAWDVITKEDFNYVATLRKKPAAA